VLELEKYLLFTGCAASSLLPHLRDLWLRLLRRILGETEIYDECCGLPLILIGNTKKAHEWFDTKLRRLLRGKTVVTGCPSCYRMLKQYVPEKLDIDPEYNTKHIVELIYESIRDNKISLSNEVKLRVTYHDPCELSRHMGLTEEPRSILRSIPGLEYVEMKLNRERSTCCGGGGLMRYLYPKVSQEITIMKLRNEVLPLNVDAIVTACPFCEYILSDAIKFLGSDNSPKIIDISELILWAMGDDNEY